MDVKEIMERANSEILGFGKGMFFHCIILFSGLSAGIWINKFFLVLVALFTVLVAMIKNVDYAYYHLFFTMPFTVVYKLSPESTSLFAYVVIAVGVILILRIHLFYINKLITIPIFAAYILAGMGRNYTTAIKMIMGVILFYFFTVTVESKNFKNHIMAFSLGVLGSSFIGTFRGSLPQLDAYFYGTYEVYGSNVVSNRFTGLNYDPNFYAILAMFVIVLCSMLFLKKAGNRAFLGVVILLQIYFGFVTYSKMFLISFLFAVFMFIIYSGRSVKTIVLTIISGYALGMGMYYWAQKSGYLSIMNNRLFEGDFSTGRFELWQIYIEYISSSIKTFWFGDGLATPYLFSVGGPHNTYIEAVYLIGITGTIIFFVTIISIFRQRKTIHRRSIINYILPAVFFVMIGALGCFTINELMFYFMLLWVGFNLDTNYVKLGDNNTKGLENLKNV